LVLRNGIRAVISQLVVKVGFAGQLITKQFGHKKGKNDQSELRSSALKR
jgi:hypothetical protein